MQTGDLYVEFQLGGCRILGIDSRRKYPRFYDLRKSVFLVYVLKKVVYGEDGEDGADQSGA